MLKIQAESNVPTDYGMMRMMAFSENEDNWMPHMAMIAEHTDFHKTVNVRIHSECITSETFHSKKCDCAEQLDAAMHYIQKNGGVVIYLRQEGRNIGIINKLRAYALQEKGFDTAQANCELGLPEEGRTYDVAIEILKLLNIKEINLLTNNPQKVEAIEKSDIILHQRIPLVMKPHKEDEGYLKVKKNHFGHFLTV